MQNKFLGLLLLGLMMVTTFNLFTIHAAPDGFVYTDGQNFMLDGQVFRFGGANNYYLHYKSDLMIDAVLNDAVAMNLRVIRCWAFMDGNGQENITMQPSLGVFNDAGFVRLDYTIRKAEELGLKLILTLTNNWDDFGGMNQYVGWTDAGGHDQFYTNSDCKTAFKNYIRYVVNRTNSLTGEKYKDSPAIFSWELANEPRCETDSTGDTIVKWADEMSSYIKSLDPRHLVSVGDEGFFNRDSRPNDYCYNGGAGVDWDRLVRLDNIDFGTVHLYPAGWGKTDEWVTRYLEDHADSGKPVILEEFGSYSNQATVYKTWCDTVKNCGYAGFMFWILTGIQDDGQLYPNYDGFRIVYPSDEATVLANCATEMAGIGVVTTATASPTPTTTPVSSLSISACAVNYTQYDWGSGATVNITIKNNGTAALTAWKLAFSFTGNQEITNLWNGAYTQSGTAVTVSNNAYNAAIPVGGSVSFGFNISYSGTNVTPSDFIVNGNACSSL